MSTRSGRGRPSALDTSPPKLRKGVSPPRSPGRTRKSSPPARSPSRKSPSRKSPSRKPAGKFPARKSPSRSTKEAKEAAAPPKSPAKRASLKNNVEVKLVDIVSGNLDSYRPSRARRTDYSIKDIQNEVSERVNGVDSASRGLLGIRNRKFAEDIVPRRSGRILESDLKRSLSKSISKSVSQSIDTFSDEDSSDDVRKEKSRSRKLATPIRDSVSKLVQYSSRWEFGGRIGSGILIILLPLTVLSIINACSKRCSLDSITDLSLLKSLSSWFSLKAAGLIFAQAILQALFCYLPVFGAKADSPKSGKKYGFNALFSSIMTFITLHTLDFLKLNDSNLILNDYLKLATTSYIIGVLLAIMLYAKAHKLDDDQLNTYGNTGFRLYDFFMGREVHPQLGRLDVKIWISRICNINTLILAALIFKHGYQLPAQLPENPSLDTYKESLYKIQLKPTVLLYSVLQIIYISNYIMRENQLTTTFYWQSEGMGYLQCVTSALYPFYFTSISKYVADSRLELPTYILVASAVLFMIGFILMQTSNSIKHAFRRNPTDPALSYLETMPTFHGKKLLISNLWGYLRHPNYTGDILIHVALALPGIVTKQYAAAIPALLTVLALLHRAWRDHARCKRRYGAAWQRYCKRVPSLIIPKIL